MKKKVLSMILATTMLLGATLAVNAAELTDSTAAANGQEVTGSSTIELPIIKVTVPTTADIIINPYQMSVEASDGVTYSNQIISVEQEIKNESNVAIAVNVSDLTTKDVSEGITITTSAISEKTTTKSALLYLEVIDGASTFADGYNKLDNQVAIPNSGEKVKAASKDAIIVLADGSTTATTAKFKIGGNVVANPVDSDGVAAPWTTTDNIGISFKFTFTPQIISE